MKKRTIVIIISFISAFILMSGGYGIWQKPLIIIGNIEVRELPPPPKVEKVLINTEILGPTQIAPVVPELLDPTQIVTVNPEIPNNPEQNVGIVLDDQNGVDEENSESIVNPENEQAVGEAADTISTSKDETDKTEEKISKSSSKIVDEEDGNATKIKDGN